MQGSDGRRGTTTVSRGIEAWIGRGWFIAVSIAMLKIAVLGNDLGNEIRNEK